MAAPQIRRMPGIDGLRALAVSAVFLYHAQVSWLPGGFLGVDLFFVISGYLITSLLLAEFTANGRIDLLRFWARRARRLLPALFVLLGVCLLVGATVDRGRLSGLRGDALWSTLYTLNWHLILEHQSYFSQFGRPPLLRHLWSLSVEEQFYLVWPPLCLIAVRLQRRRLMLVGVALGVLVSTAAMWLAYAPSNSSRVFYGTDTRAAPLLVGVLLALVWKPGSLPALRAPGARLSLDSVSVLALAAVAYELVTVHDSDSGLYHGGFLVLALCAAALLGAIVHPLSLLARALASPVPRFHGERSYGIYLWHWPVLCFSRPGIDVHLDRGILIPLQAIATVAIATLSYRYVEQPIRQGALRLPGREVPGSFALAGAAFALLLVLIAVTPQGASAVPPGFGSAALARSAFAANHLVALPPSHRSRPAPSAGQAPALATGPLHTTGAQRATVKPVHRAAVPRVARRAVHRLHVQGTRALPTTGPILAVGDSVMLGASGALRDRLGADLRVDAVVARQADLTIGRLAAYRAEGSLPQRVIVHIGDNGPIYSDELADLKQVLKGVPLVVLVNVRVGRDWQGEVNDELANTIKGWHQATIADWVDESAGPGIVVSDGTHVTEGGARLFAALLWRALHHPVLGGVTH